MTVQMIFSLLQRREDSLEEKPEERKPGRKTEQYIYKCVL
jgi:hypothetical protein